jgi:hypothetical protein
MRRFITLFGLFLLFSVSAGVAQMQAQNSAPAPADVTEHRITTARVNVHACPELDCEILTTYVEGTPLFILGEDRGDVVEGDSQWYRIRDALTGQEGYISHVVTADGRFDDWELRPVFPASVSDTMRDVYARGMERGNDANAFSKTGDCQNVVPYFLSPFEDGANYDLGAFGSLQATIDQFDGSFDRVSASVDNGFNVAAVLSPLWANKKICTSGETPLLCEERLHNPSIAIVNMETWWQQRPVSEYEAYLSRIVEFWLDQDVVPILGTKADNLEGDNAINAAIVRVADKYEVPLWNFWLAVQQIPGHGLAEDAFHLTFARDFYDDPHRLEFSWPVRNLTALQALDAVWRALNGNS